MACLLGPPRGTYLLGPLISPIIVDNSDQFELAHNFKYIDRNLYLKMTC